MSKANNHKFTSEYEKTETNKIKLTITASPELFRDGLQKAYLKNRNYFNMPGFRQGRAPRKLIEQAYGRDIFHEDAINIILPDAYEQALEEHGLEPVYKPEEIKPGEMSEATGAVFYIQVYVRPEVTIDGYYGLTYPKMDTAATENDIQEMLEAEQNKNARLIDADRPSENGDTLTIDFKGFIGDEPFEGGEAKNHNLVLGSGQFIPGFEEQLIGHEVGDDVEVEVTFPDDYGSEELAGKPAIFEVEILEIKVKELPELNDDFAQDVSEFDTMADYKENLAKTITERKISQQDANKRSHLLKQLVPKAEMEVPEAMYQARLDESWDSLVRQIESQGIDMETYMRITNMTEKQVRDNWSESTVTNVDSQLALEAVAIKEGLTVSDEEFTKHVGEMSTTEGEELTKLVSNISNASRKDLERGLLCTKALDFVMEKAIEVDEPILEQPIVINDPVAPATESDIIDGEAKEVNEEENNG